MNRLFRPAVLSAGLTAIAIAFGSAGTAHAQRTNWEGFDSNGTRSNYVRDAAGRWTETVSGRTFAVTYIFAESEVTDQYIQLFDVSRNVYVRLFNDRMDIWDTANSRWTTLYYGHWMGQNTGRWLVTFKSAYVWDDKEGGDGDWKIKATVGDNVDVTIVGNQEAGTGEYVIVNYPGLYVAGNSFTMSVRVFEHDGGIGAKWEFVGHQEITITQSGDGYELYFNNDEGQVTVYFTVEAV